MFLIAFEYYSLGFLIYVHYENNSSHISKWTACRNVYRYIPKIMEDTLKDKFKIDFKMIQNKSTKNQVTAIWKYDNEQHLKEVRKYLSKHNSIPNSLSPKEVVFSGDIILES